MVIAQNSSGFSTSVAVALQLKHVHKCFGGTVALDDVSLSVHEGELLTLVGPSGAGKSTLLKWMAGALTADRGELYIDGQRVTDLRQQQREVGAAFAPGALGQALLGQPRVLLLDEPFSGLDKHQRLALEGELKAVQRKLGMTIVLATHDQREALGLSDRIAVMCAGRIRQVGTPAELYRRPQDPFVASFIGDANVLPGRYLSCDKHATVELASSRLRVPAEQVRADVGARLHLYVRPEHIHLTALGPRSQLSATVIAHVFKGDHVDIHLDVPALGQMRLLVRQSGLDALTRWPPGAAAGLAFDGDGVCAFAADLSPPLLPGHWL